MVVDARKKEKLLYRISYIGGIFSFVWGIFLFYWMPTAPTVPDEMAGRVYAYNYHGTAIYLNLIETVVLYALPGAVVLICSIIVMLERRWKLKLND